MSVLAATRPTRRDAVRRPWQSLAAILLIAFPVAFFSVVFTDTTSSVAASQLTDAPTIVSYGGGSCEQSVDGYSARCSGDGSTPAGRSQQEVLAAVLPEGFGAQLLVEDNVLFTSGETQFQFQLIQVPEGGEHLPAPGEVLVPRGQLELLGAEVGDTLTVPTATGDTELRVAGVTPGYAAVVTEPTFLDPAAAGSDRGSVTEWALSGPRKFTWEDVETLNAAGFIVRSEDVAEDPPPPGIAWEAGEATIYDSPDVVSETIGVILYLIGVVVVAFLVLALISPVFTISVSRQSRNFALMASQGAAPRHIRWAVLVYGLFAGLLGASLGLVLGGLGVIGWWAQRYPEWPIMVPWGLIAALWGFAVLAATVAAFLPAVIASRASIIAGIHGASPDRLLRWRRWMLIGPVLVLLSLLFLISSQFIPPPTGPGYSLGFAALLRGFGALSGVPGIALSAPAAVWLVGRFRGPLALRVAGRDLLRQSLRSIPAVAAIAAFITVSSAVLINQEADTASRTQLTAEAYRPGTLFIQGSEGMDQAMTVLNQVLGPVAKTDVQGLGSNLGQGGYTYLQDDPEHPVHAECDWAAPDSEACLYQMSSAFVSGPTHQLGAAMVVATPELLDALGLPAEAADGSAMLVEENTHATGATFRLNSQRDNEETEALGDPVALDLAPVIPVEFNEWLPTPAAFAEFGVAAEHLGALVTAERNPTSAEMQEIGRRLADSGSTVSAPVVERGIWGTEQQARLIFTGVVVLIVALVLMLSMGHTRRQHNLLAAVGAPPRLNRSINALFGALITLTGSVLGLFAGHVGALLTASRRRVSEAGWIIDPGAMAHVGIDWWLVLGLVVLAPLVAAALGWILTPRTQLSEYRAD